MSVFERGFHDPQPMPFHEGAQQVDAVCGGEFGAQLAPQAGVFG
jgi:hypothetical protein